MTTSGGEGDTSFKYRELITPPIARGGDHVVFRYHPPMIQKLGIVDSAALRARPIDVTVDASEAMIRQAAACEAGFTLEATPITTVPGLPTQVNLVGVARGPLQNLLYTTGVVARRAEMKR